MNQPCEDTERRNADFRQWHERIIRVETKQDIDIEALAVHKADTKEEFNKVYTELKAGNEKSDKILEVVTSIKLDMSVAKGKYSVWAGVGGALGGVMLMIVAHLIGWL
jgi:hypothetical protein